MTLAWRANLGGGVPSTRNPDPLSDRTLETPAALGVIGDTLLLAQAMPPRTGTMLAQGKKQAQLTPLATRHQLLELHSRRWLR